MREEGRCAKVAKSKERKRDYKERDRYTVSKLPGGQGKGNNHTQAFKKAIE